MHANPGVANPVFNIAIIANMEALITKDNVKISCSGPFKYCYSKHQAELAKEGRKKMTALYPFRLEQLAGLVCVVEPVITSDCLVRQSVLGKT